MKDWIIEKRLNQLRSNGKSPAENNRDLLLEYAQDRKNGVLKEESEARTLLILFNNALINYVIYNKFCIIDKSDCGDEYSVCKLGLIKAIDKFDIDKNLEFSTYAVKVIQNEMLMYYRKENSVSNIAEHDKISIEDCMMEEFKGEPKLQFSHNFSEEPTFIDEVILKDEINNQYKNFVHLTPMEQIVIIQSFGLFNVKPLRHKDIGDRYGKTRSCISNILIRGLRKLKILASSDEKLTDEQKILKYKIKNKVYDLNPIVKENILNQL